MNKKTTHNFWHIWMMPILLAIMSLVGLLSALIGDNFLDLFSWITLTIPLVVMAWFVVIALNKKGKSRRPTMK